MPQKRNIVSGSAEERRCESVRNKELVKRYILFTLSLFFTAVGIAVTKKGELGVSPLSSFSNVLSYQFPGISFGTWLFLWNMLLLVLQILILRKNFQMIQLLQIPLSVIFGVFTDIGMFSNKTLYAKGAPDNNRIDWYCEDQLICSSESNMAHSHMSIGASTGAAHPLLVEYVKIYPTV